MRKEIIHYTVNNVRSIAKEENLQISILVQDWFEQGRTLGSLCMVNGEYDAERAFEIVTTVNASNTSQIAVFNAEGEGIGKDGESLDVSSETYFAEVMAGKALVMDVNHKTMEMGDDETGEFRQANDKKQQAVGTELFVAAIVPIENENGDVVGGVAGFYSCDTLAKLLGSELLSEVGTACIIFRRSN